MEKKILILTTNRSDYSKLECIINIIYKNKNTKLYLIVSGSHLLTDFGNSYKNIKYPIYKKINTLVNCEDNKMMAESVGFALIKYSSLLEEIKPDYVLLHGDRFDILSMTNACLLMNISIIHIEGGEHSGCVDNTIRNFTSMVAKYHIVANEQAKKNLIKLLNTDKNIINMGCPIIDKYINFNFTMDNWNIFLKSLITDCNITRNDYIIMLFHIDTLDIENSILQYKTLYNLLLKLNKQIFCFYPNIDNISKELIRYIDKKKTDKILFLKNLHQHEFITLLSQSSLFIGNSSCLVREAPMLGIPTILIGERQKQRLLYKSTIHFSEIDEKELLTAINNNYGKRYSFQNLYGDGRFSLKFNNFINKVID
jgi:UDP-hydrolysing UDP-N-acetyl-D-glucosamine 2-epimerase